MKVTKKQIKLHAEEIKKRKCGNVKSWSLLRLYVKQFDNVYQMWGDLCVHRGHTYTPLNKIIKSDYFLF